MDFKNKVFIIVLVALMFISVSACFASENATEISEVDEADIQSVDGESAQIADEGLQDEYNAKIIANDYSSYYYSDKELVVKVKDLNNENLNDVEVNLVYSNKFVDSGYVENGKCGFYVYENAGKYKATLTLKDSYYNAKPVTINVKVAKAPVYLKVNKPLSDTKSITILKAAVYDKYGINMDEGVVAFRINGKTYYAKVKDGVASRKIILPKAKTYAFKASFSSKNYYSKLVSSKAVVKKAKKYYTFKAGKYSVKLTSKQFHKLINAKLNGKYELVEKKTGKYYSYKKPAYKTVKVTKTKWVYKNVMSYESFYYDDGSVDSYSYDLTRYYNNGWKLYGWYDKSYSDGFESYAKLKKKVKYTTTKKVKNGYKSAKAPIYMIIETLPHDALSKKGDYITVWADDGIEMGKHLIHKRINLYSYL